MLCIECSCRAIVESAQPPNEAVHKLSWKASLRLAEDRRSDWYQALVSLSTSCFVPASSTMSNEHRTCHPPRQDLTYGKPPATILSEAAWYLHECQSSKMTMQTRACNERLLLSAPVTALAGVKNHYARFIVSVNKMSCASQFCS